MTEVTRSDSGQFLKGQSGNPSGRPLGKKNQITELKQDLEIAVRKNVDADDVTAIINKMVAKAKEGSIPAAKIILDKVVSNARDVEDVKSHDKGINVIITNLTAEAIKQAPVVTVEPIEE